jgi:hypothetical protein
MMNIVRVYDINDDYVLYCITHMLYIYIFFVNKPLRQEKKKKKKKEKKLAY